MHKLVDKLILINEEKETNLLYRLTANNVDRYSILKEGEHKSPFITFGLHIVTSFGKVPYGKPHQKKKKNRVTLQEKKLTLTTSAMQSRSA